MIPKLSLSFLHQELLVASIRLQVIRALFTVGAKNKISYNG